MNSGPSSLPLDYLPKLSLLRGILWYTTNSNLCRIFRFGGPPNVWGCPIFRGWNEILLLGKALKFGVICQKFALRLIKVCQIIGKIREKCKFFGNFLIFWPAINF